MVAFSFASNPFVVLPVSVKAKAADVEDSFRRRLAARPGDEAALTSARTQLLEPDSRLASEVAWLIDAAPREAAGLLGAMAGGDQAALLQALDAQPALTKANVAADACTRLKSTAFLAPLSAAHNAIDSVKLTGLINDIHTDIPIPAVAPRQLEGALRALTALHAGAAMAAISAQPDPAAALQSLTAGLNGVRSGFITELLRQYEGAFPSAPSAEADASAPGIPDVAALDAVSRGEPDDEPWMLAPAASAAGPAPEPTVPRTIGADRQGWSDGASGAAAASAAFMDARLVFSEPARFHTFGNSRRVRTVLYVLAGGLSAVILAYLVLGKGPPPNDDRVADPGPDWAAQAAAQTAAEGHQHHPKQCINVSGGSYCTQ